MFKKQKAWSSLPNAHHIDWVLASLKDNHKLWKEAWNEAWDEASDEAWDEAWDEARKQARNEAWRAASDAARDAASDAAWRAARDVILALIAYDDCDQYLAMGYKKLLTYVVLSEKPQALLLLPIAYVKEQLNNNQLLSA